MPAKKLVVIGAIALALLVLGALAAVLAQVSISPGGNPPAIAGAAPQVNALTIIGDLGTTRYVAAGTSQGLRVYELRRVGNEYQVKDVTAEAK